MNFSSTLIDYNPLIGFNPLILHIFYILFIRLFDDEFVHKISKDDYDSFLYF